MFPRIKTYQRKGKTYEYLVISESVHQPGKGSTTKDIAILGNTQRFKNGDIGNLIDGLIKIFQLEKSPAIQKKPYYPIDQDLNYHLASNKDYLKN